MTSRVPALIVHGGAGADPTEGIEELRHGIVEAVWAGWSKLAAGASAVDAVEVAVRSLEDHPRFNAGHGSVLTTAGTVETDASIMEGDTLRNGAVACVSGVRNPITLARRILESGRHCLFVGAGALERARALGVPLCDPRELVTDRQRRRLEAMVGQGAAAREPNEYDIGRSAALREPSEHGNPGERIGPRRAEPEARPADMGIRPSGSEATGTVGAVALDRHGLIAAATSTGGTAGKLPGRAGDSALIGCGTYAESTLGGISCTGDGEAIIRVVLARRALEILRGVDDPRHACLIATDVLVEEGRGQGGLILVDWKGRLGWGHSTPLMPVGWMTPAVEAPVVPF